MLSILDRRTVIRLQYDPSSRIGDVSNLVLDGPLMGDMTAPSPGEEDVHIQEVRHGKSASNSCTSSVVSGASPGGTAKTVAPVCGQRTTSDGLERE